MNLCVLIMAGGRGTRFWPLSTDEKPKQFLSLINDNTMLQMTVNRIKDAVPMERIFICTGERYVKLVKEQLPDLSERNIIVEPEGRNTAPCIALSAMIINRYYKNYNMVVLPSDHLINDEQKFRDTIIAANIFVNKYKEALVTLGINPTRPETGYGYIQYDMWVDEILRHNVMKVKSFKEKPNEENAIRYINEGNYLWNGGMFIWNIENIIKQIKKYSPSTYEALHGLEEVKEENLQYLINANYKNTEAISIDYAVMEKSENVYVMPSNFGWDDIGSWEAIERYRESDEAGNIHVGSSTTINGENNLIIAHDNRVIVEGLSNIYVIQNDNKVIVGRKENVKNVKELRNMV